MDKIKCNINQLDNDNQRVTANINIMKEEIQIIQTVMSTLKEAWEGPSADAFLMRMEDILNEMTKVVQMLDTMAKFEATSVDTYSNGETHIETLVADVTVA